MTTTPEFRALCAELAKLARQVHYRCEDSWYSCPKSPDGCANDSAGDECTCGADSHNDKIDELLARAALATPPPEPVAYIHRQGNYWEPSERVLQDDEKERGWTEEPLYAAAPPPEPPTDEEIAAAIQKGADQEFYATVDALTQYCGCGVELTSGDAREVLYELRRPQIVLDDWLNEKPYS